MLFQFQVMLEAKWPSPKSKGHLRWIKIRNVIIGIAHFRRSIRRRSMSIYSNSGSEFDQISHASVDSYLTETQVATKAEAADVSPTLLLKDSTIAVEDGLSKNSNSLEERMSTGLIPCHSYPIACTIWVYFFPSFPHLTTFTQHYATLV